MRLRFLIITLIFKCGNFTLQDWAELIIHAVTDVRSELREHRHPAVVSHRAVFQWADIGC